MMNLADLTDAFNSYVGRYGTTPDELCVHRSVYDFLFAPCVGPGENEYVLFLGARVRVDHSGILGEGDFMFGSVPTLDNKVIGMWGYGY